jgi:hydroxymethylglutaryl-CoA reductase (NADPH)
MKTPNSSLEESAESNSSPDIVPRLPQQGYAAEHVAQRRRWVEEKTGASLPHVARCSVDTEQMRGNIENPIGAIQMPLGLAGPLEVRGEHAQGTFYVPLATSEGALVRSYERGMVHAMRLDGGAASLIVGR